MNKRKDIFSFKQFSVMHVASSMKVGVDGVLIGAWADVTGRRGLDIGCGCGLIALMAAQRNEDATIDAIDIHRASVVECKQNFFNSPWAHRLSVEQRDIREFQKEKQDYYDFIISNPPFFRSGIHQPNSPREQARHIGTLSQFLLPEIGNRLLAEEGRLSFIFPYEFTGDIITIGTDNGLCPERICTVADRKDKKPKRTMITLCRGIVKGQPERTELFIRDEAGEYTEEYKKLTAFFYLKF